MNGMYYHTPEKVVPESCMMYNAGAGTPYRQHHQMTLPMLPAKRLRADGAEILRCKRRMDISKLGYKAHPNSVARRNERERNRVKHINTTFATLRQHIPCAAKTKKLSKVDTLRSAIKYIKHLQQILDIQEKEGDAGIDNTSNIDPESPASAATSSEEIEPIVIKPEPNSPQTVGTPSTTSTCTATSDIDAASPSSHTHSSPPVSPASNHAGSQGSCPEDESYSSDPSYAYSPGTDDLADLVDWFQ